MNCQDISRLLLIYTLRFRIQGTARSCSLLRRAGPERAVEVGDEVLDVLDAHGYPDEVVRQAALLADRGGDGRVRHEARQADERLHAPEADRYVEVLGGFDDVL